MGIIMDMKRLIIFLTILMFFLFTGCGVDSFNESSESTDNSTNDSNNVIDNSVDILEDDEDSDDVDGGEDSDGENPDCSVGTNGVDGAGGFLWKPISEGDGNLVILFPAEFDVPFRDVFVFATGGDIESGNFVGFSNGNRQTWRFDFPGSAYTGQVTVDDIGQECDWFVESPGERQD